MNKIFKWAVVLIALSINFQSLYAHKDHKDKPTMPAIGIVQGEVLDSTSMKPIEYASVSLVNLEHNELATGGLSDKNGRVSITEIPLGKYRIQVGLILRQAMLINGILNNSELKKILSALKKVNKKIS